MNTAAPADWLARPVRPAYKGGVGRQV